jgi:hypothetical protein
MAIEADLDRPVGAGSLTMRGGLAVVLGCLTNAILVLVLDALGVAPGFRPISVPPVVLFSAIGTAGATITYGVLRRFSDTPDATFLRVAVVVLLLSLLPDLALLDRDPSATVIGVVALMFMHVVVAAVSVGALVYWRRR